MSIWFKPFQPEEGNRIAPGTLLQALGIEITEVGEDFLKGRMPVDARTIQPAGIMHGGASAALAETLGSMAAYMSVDPEKFRTVGLELNINHIRSAKLGSGWVYGTARPVHLGRSTQVWDIRIEDGDGRTVAVSRHTVSILTLSN
jgi:1,4-dihydroxy-2-naphthoyl-CoA hydrolase